SRKAPAIRAENDDAGVAVQRQPRDLARGARIPHSNFFVTNHGHVLPVGAAGVDETPFAVECNAPVLLRAAGLIHPELLITEDDQPIPARVDVAPLGVVLLHDADDLTACGCVYDAESGSALNRGVPVAKVEVFELHDLTLIRLPEPLARYGVPGLYRAVI